MQLSKLCQSITKTISKNKKTVIFLNTGDILNGKILHNNFSLTNTLPGQAKKIIENNDILFSEIRPKNGRYALVNVERPNDYVVSTKLMVIRCNDKVIPKYLYYFLTSPIIINYLQELAESRSGTFPQITFDEIKNLEIDLPSIDVQQHIVNTIGSIDDLIEKNSRILSKIEELEYKLFSYEMNDKASNKLSNYISFEKGKKPNEINQTGNLYLTIDVLEGNTKLFTNSSNIITCSKNEILMVMDGASSGKVYTGVEGVVGSTLSKIKNTCLNNYFLYIFLKYNFNNIKDRNTGSAIPHTNKDFVLSLSIPNMKADENLYDNLFNYRNKTVEIISKLKEIKKIYLHKFFK